MKHLFIDKETMGTDTDKCAVIDCSIMVVSTEKMLSGSPYTCKSIVDTVKYKLSIKDQVSNYGWEVDKNTVEFWSLQGDDAKRLIKPQSTDLSVKDFRSQLLRYLQQQGKINYWWSRSNTFDPPILWRMIKGSEEEKHIHKCLPHYLLREMRTFIDAKLDFPPENGFCPITDVDFWNKVFVKHDSSWDVLADVLRMQAILRAENDLEAVAR